MSWWKTAKVGDKVVCVDAELNSDYYETPLVEGEIYTICSIEPSWVGSVYNGKAPSSGMQVTLAGCPHPCSDRHGFEAARFQPIHRSKRTTKTGMAILNDIRTRAEDYEVV